MQFRCPQTFALRTGFIRFEDGPSLRSVVEIHERVDGPHWDTIVARESHVELSIGVADPWVRSVLFGDVHACGVVPDHVLDEPKLLSLPDQLLGVFTELQWCKIEGLIGSEEGSAICKVDAWKDVRSE